MMPSRIDPHADDLRVGTRTGLCTERPYGKIAAREDDAMVSFFDTLISCGTEASTGLEPRVPVRHRAFGRR